MDIPVGRFQEQDCWRIIPSRFPPIDLFRDVAPPEHWGFLQELESQTNMRLQEDTLSRGAIRPEDNVEESSSPYILGPLVRPNPNGSRFSDGSFGVLYAGLDFETSLAEIKSRREIFLSRTSEEAQRVDMRAVIIQLDGELHDIRGELGKVYADTEKSRDLALKLREAGSYGLVFDSDARPGGCCICVFRPPVLTNARQERHLAFVWDGKSIADTYEYSKSADRALGGSAM